MSNHSKHHEGHKKLHRLEREEVHASKSLTKAAQKLERLWKQPVTEALQWRSGMDIRKFDTAATPGFIGDADDGLALIRAVQPELEDLQERLFAQGKKGSDQALLLVIQGLDTAGKGGIVRHVVGLVDPQGVAHSSFGVPTAEEKANGYLWRITNALPKPGQIGVFDRSQYEQVLIVRVNGQEPQEVWSNHYDEINEFETKVIAAGTTIVKVAMFVSKDEQKRRLLARLDRQDKYYKYNPDDLITRSHWGDYEKAYQDLLDRTSTAAAPWYAIPADNKWYSRLAVTQLLLEALRGMDLQWPEADFDVTEQKRLVSES